MRKYQRLSLLIISVICFFSFLFYRHEYLKLRSVVSVLNFFGNVRSDNASCVVLSDDFKTRITRRYNYLEPRSVWTRLDGHYVYSSFWEGTAHGGGYIRTLTIGPVSSFKNFKCNVWFEIGDVISSKTGRFKFDLDVRSISKTVEANENGNNKSRKYLLKCYVSDVPEGGTPYGVLWITPSNSSNVFSPVFAKKEVAKAPVICVKPDYAVFAKTNLIEFLSFYDAIGVSDFIIYDSRIQHSLYPFLESIAVRGDRILRSVTILPWNFPLTDSTLESLSVNDDCLSRTLSVAKVVGIVAWNEYIYPQDGKLDALEQYATADFVHSSVNAWHCCTNWPDSTSSENYWPQFLRKTKCVRGPSEDNLHLNLKSDVAPPKRGNHRSWPSQIATLRRYDTCLTLPLESESVILPVPDIYNRVASHQLLQIWKSYLNASAIFY